MSNVHGLFSKKKDDDDDSHDERENRFVGGIGAQGGGRYETTWTRAFACMYCMEWYSTEHGTGVRQYTVLVHYLSSAALIDSDASPYPHAGVSSSLFTQLWNGMLDRLPSLVSVESNQIASCSCCCTLKYPRY
jgi:hypothetical protein